MRPDPLQTREAFHLAFLRGLARSVPPSSFALKGGSNLRFFFGSIRYSEVMDLDAGDLPVHLLRDKVMGILDSSGLADTLRTFGIARIQPPDITRAKQTETVQRFKVHLHTTAAEDLHTKVEFSRPGFDTPIRPESVSAPVLAAYRMAPLIVPHYTGEAAVQQKVRALMSRPEPQARDVFDLHVLSAHREAAATDLTGLFAPAQLSEARERIYSIGYRRFRDTVVSFLGPEDRTAHDSEAVWDEIRLAAVSLLERGMRDEA
jgi:hypothetical protein